MWFNKMGVFVYVYVYGHVTVRVSEMLKNLKL